MAEHLSCEEGGCKGPAKVFGFVNKIKRIACESHALLLIQMRTTIYPIAAFVFIKSPVDASLYEERKTMMQKGLGNLSSLETACEKDWEAGQKHLQESCDVLHDTVQKSFQEMWLRGQQCFEDMKQRLKVLRGLVEQLVLHSSYQPSPQVIEICECVPKELVFRLKLGDCRLSVAEVILQSFHLLAWDVSAERQRDWAGRLQVYARDQTEQADVAMEVAECAELLGSTVFDFSFAATQQKEVSARHLRDLFACSRQFEAASLLKQDWRRANLVLLTKHLTICSKEENCSGVRTIQNYTCGLA
jgi:hypothetical protein